MEKIELDFEATLLARGYSLILSWPDYDETIRQAAEEDETIRLREIRLSEQRKTAGNVIEADPAVEPETIQTKSIGAAVYSTTAPGRHMSLKHKLDDN